VTDADNNAARTQVRSAAETSWIVSSGAAAAPDPRQAVGATEDGVQVRPRLVFFHSKVSGRCRRVEALIAQVLQCRGNHRTFVLRKVDIDERPDLAERFRIEAVPTLLVVADRRVRARLEHPKGCREIEAMLKPWLHEPSIERDRRRRARTARQPEL
jgi:thioredoxin-like negative regulator of GroEL